MSPVTLPDGSVVEVERRDTNRSLVSRYVDGVCVWGQSFGCSPREDHDAQIAEIVADMASRPDDFRRWWDPSTGATPSATTRPRVADPDPGADPATAPGSTIATSSTNATSPSTRAGLDVSQPGETATQPGSTCAGESESGTPRMGSTTTPTTRNATAPAATGPVA